MRARAPVCMCARMLVHVCAYACIFVRARARACEHVCACVNACARVCMCTRMCTHMCVYSCACVHVRACVGVRVCTCMCVCLHVCMSVNVCAHDSMCVCLNQRLPSEDLGRTLGTLAPSALARRPRDQPQTGSAFHISQMKGCPHASHPPPSKALHFCGGCGCPSGFFLGEFLGKVAEI